MSNGLPPYTETKPIYQDIAALVKENNRLEVSVEFRKKDIAKLEKKNDGIGLL